MSLRDVRAVYAKEMRETLRDRRTLFVMIVLPLLLYPLIGVIGVEAVAANRAGRERHLSTVSIDGAGAAAARLRAVLGRTKGLTLKPGGRAALERHEVGAVLRLPPDLDARLGAGETASVTLLSDDANDDSQQAAARLQEALADFARAETAAALRARGLPTTLARPLDVKTENVARKDRMGGYVLSLVLPMVTVLMVILGAFYPAIDVTAGEKERGTLETILCAPIERRDLVTGKFLCVATIALFAAVLNLASLGITAVTLLRSTELTVHVPWRALPPVLLALVPAALLFSALMVAVAALARSFKEAQNALTPVYLACALPTMVVTLLPGVKLTWALALVPGVNVSLLVKDLMRAEAAVGPALLACVVTCVYAYAALRFAAAVFDSERLLFAGEAGAWRPWRGRAARSGGPGLPGGSGLPGGPGVPDGAGLPGGPGVTGTGLRTALGASEATLLYASIFVGLVLVGTRAQAWRLMPGLLITEWLLVLLPVVAYLRLARVDLVAGLGLRRPPALALAGALLCGAATWYLVVALVEVSLERVLPVPQELVRELQRLAGGHPLGVELLVVALSPAICEEVLFRGALLRGLLGRVGKPTAVVLTAILFGLFHLSLYRFVPTALIGLVIGYVAVTSRSLWPAMVVHATNNAIAIGLARVVPNGVDGGHVDGRLAGAAAVTLVIGLYLVWRAADGESRVRAHP